MSDLDKIEIGERVVSLDPEDDGAAGEVVATGSSHLRIKWDDGSETWSTRRDGVRREDAGPTRHQRDRIAALVTIFLRDAIVLAGGDDTVGALDDLAVRAEFLEAAAQLTETAILAPILEGSLDEESNEQIRAAIGQALIDAAAAKVIDAHRACVARAIDALVTLS